MSKHYFMGEPYGAMLGRKARENMEEFHRQNQKMLDDINRELAELDEEKAELKNQYGKSNIANDSVQIRVDKDTSPEKIGKMVKDLLKENKNVVVSF